MPNVWKISPGRNAGYWNECFERKCIAIDWLNDTDLREFETPQEIKQALIESTKGLGGGASSLWPFVHEVAKGDIVVANQGLSKIVGIGVITSHYLPPGHRRNPNKEWFCQTRLVDWQVSEFTSFRSPIFNQPTLQRLSSEKEELIKRKYWKHFPDLHDTLDVLFPVRLPTDEADDGSSTYIPDDEDHRRFVERQIRERRGQRAFRDSLRRQFGDQCVVTGCTVIDVLEAAHINPYRGTKDNDVRNGLLLRADIHTLFDLNLLGINPKTLKVELHSKIKDEYGDLAGKSLGVGKTKPSSQALKKRYAQFLEGQSS